MADESKTMSRKERELQFRLDLVLDAALEVFMEQPYAAAKIDDIAERAELSVGTLYNLFDSKQEIYKAMVSRQQDLYFSRAHKELDVQSDPADQIRSVVRVFLVHVSENFKAWRFHVYASAGLSSTIRNELYADARVSMTAFLQRLTGVCATGLESGVFKSGLQPQDMALAINAVSEACTNLAFQKNDPDLQKLMPAAIEAVDRIAGVAH